MGKLDQFKDFDAALARLAFREERMRPAHARGDIALSQPGFFARYDQFLQKSVIESLMGRRPPLARDSSLRLPLLPHLSSVVNA